MKSQGISAFAGIPFCFPFPSHSPPSALSKYKVGLMPWVDTWRSGRVWQRKAARWST
jgi:hypothetical protein